MALKDWKQGIDKDLWYRKDDKYGYVRVWKTGLPLKEMKRRGHSGNYIFEARVKGENYEKKYFKTKSQALKFGRIFRSKH